MKQLNIFTRIFSLVVLVFGCFVFYTTAYGITFQPLSGEGVEGLTDPDTTKTLGGLLSSLYQIMISLAAVLAVVMIFYAGFKYTISSSESGRSDAKKRILAAIGGLALALSSWLILSTINPEIVDVNLEFQDIEFRELDFELLAQQGRDRIVNTYKATFVASGNNQGAVLNPGELLTGGGSIGGIPLKGSYNRFIANDPSHKSRGFGNGIELYNEKVSFNGNDWVSGKASWFGTSADTTGVTATETGAILGVNLRSIGDFRGVAVRWDYDLLGRSALAAKQVIIYSPTTGKTSIARPLDWGPHLRTGRAIDVTPRVMEDLGFGRRGGTDEVLYFRFAN